MDLCRSGSKPGLLDSQWQLGTYPTGPCRILPTETQIDDKLAGDPLEVF